MATFQVEIKKCAGFWKYQSCCTADVPVTRVKLKTFRISHSVQHHVAVVVAAAAAKATVFLQNTTYFQHSLNSHLHNKINVNMLI